MSKKTMPIRLGGKDFVLSAPDFADIQSLQNFCKYRRYYKLKKEAELIPDLKPMLPDVLKECSQTDVSIEQVGAMIQNERDPDIGLELFYLCLRKVHTTLSREEMEQLFSEDASIDEASTMVNDMMGLIEKEGESKNDRGRTIGQ